MINLRNTYKEKHYPNISEVYGNTMYERLYEVASSYIEKGYKAGLYGTDCADKYWKGLLYHQMIILYAEFFANEYKRLIEAGEDCPIEKVKEKYKYDCLYDNLNCISNEYGGNLSKILDESLIELGIDINIDCDSCCEGISTMVIGGIDDCNSFMINQCNNE